MSFLESLKTNGINFDDYFVVIACELGHIYESGEISPTFATLCIKPHWDSDGVMFTSGIYDATKFNLDDEDLDKIFEVVQERNKNKDLSLVLVPKMMCGSLPRECWSSKSTRGSFDETGELFGENIKEVY